MIRPRWFLAIAWLGTAPLAAQAAPLHVLFVGNSFTYVNDLPARFAELAEAAGLPRPVTAMVAAPDVSLEDQMSEGTAARRLAAERWDIVVLQQGPSTLTASGAHLVAWTRQWAPLIRRAGAEPVLYMVWPGTDRLAATDSALAHYRAAAEAVQGRLAPAGLAWREAFLHIPEAGVAAADGFHPSPSGSYLAALVLLATITGRDPLTLPAVAPGLPRLAPGVVRRLQQVAHDVGP